MSVTVAVMAHPARGAMATALARDLGAWISWDRYGSRWDTGRRAWLSLANSPHSHGMVIQDDALPAKNLMVNLDRILGHIPDDSPLVLYAGATARWNRTWREIPRTVGLLTMDWIWWGPAIVLPTPLIEQAVEYGDAEAEKGSDQYDHLLGAWFTRNAIPVYYTWPSLVDHRNGPSLVPGRVANRRAFRFQRNADLWKPGRLLNVAAPE